MMSGGAGPGDAASQLAQLRSAAAAVRAAVSTAAPVPSPPTADTADWESRLAAVNAAVGGSARPTKDQSGSGGPAGDGDARTDVTSGCAVHAPYQAELINSISDCPGNCVTFLPLGLGLRSVVDSVLVRAVAQHPGKHVLLVVDRPAHALSHAQRLRTELGLPTAVFCGGDFLYSFPQQFQTSRVLVFTAGLLLRLLKTGVYSLEQASLMMLLDAFTVVRNHPSNTLVREYWRGAEEGHRPRVVGVLASQLPSKPRPFDRLRQNLRKLCHSLQAALLLPAGCGLAQMEAQLHHDPIQLHSYALGTPEERLASLLQQHLLGLWDVLHEFGLNHFGRLVQFAAASSGPGAGGGGTPGTQPGTPAAGAPAAACATPPQSAGAGAGPSTRTPDQHSPAPGTPLSARPLSAGGSPGGVEGSPSTPLHGLLQGGVAGGQHAGGSSAAAAAAEQPDPMQHDWAQVELQVIHSLWHSNALPNKGEHVREPDALALQMHVLDCVRALRALLEQGPVACLARLPQALDSLADFMSEGVGLGGLPGAVATPPLRARILQVAGASPLLPWALQEQKRAAAAAEEVSSRQAAQQAAQAAAAGAQLGQGLQVVAGMPAGEERREAAAAAAAGAATPPRAPPPRPRASPQPKPSPRRMASGGGAASLADGPQAAVAAGSARVAATLQLLQELQVGCQLSGQRRLTAVVAGSREAVAMLQRVIGRTQDLQFAEVRELREALADPEGFSRATSSAAAAAPAAAAAVGLSRAASLGRAASLRLSRAASLGRTGSGGLTQTGSNGAVAAASSSGGGSPQAELQSNDQLVSGQQEGHAASGSGEAGEAPADAAVGALGAAEGTEPSPAQDTEPADEVEAAMGSVAATTVPEPEPVAEPVAERSVAAEPGAASEAASGAAGSSAGSSNAAAELQHPAADAAGTAGTAAVSGGDVAESVAADAAGTAGTSSTSSAAGPAGAAALDLVTSPSETEAAFAAAWAHAAPTVRVGQLVVHLLTSADLVDLERHISSYHSLVWYSAGDVLHAASQELESAALAACHRLSAAYTAAASAAADAARKSRRSITRLECHVLSTGSQVLALGEVRRVDHSLKAAMELVGLGDSTAEEKLTMLAHRNTAGVLEPEARVILEMLCCGLCGAAPAFATMTASPMRKPSSSSRRLADADAVTAAAATEAAASGEVPLAAGEGGPEGSGGGGANGREVGKEGLDGASKESEEAAGELPTGVSLTTAGTAEGCTGGAGAGAEAASDGEDGQLAAAQPSILFRSSITLPAAYFPPERFHSQGVSMPMDVFVGPALPSEEQAANAAALLALAALHRLGIIVRYWPSRLLLAQHLLPRSLAAAGVPASALQQGATGSAAEAANAAWAAAIGAPAAGMQQQQQLPTQQQLQQLQQQTPTNVTNFFCPLCNVAATGHKAFDAHLRGFRHQRRIKQAQLLQQGQEVSAMLQGLLLDETAPAAAAAAAAALAGGGGGQGRGDMHGALHGVAVRRPALDELMEEEEGGEHGSPTFADRQVYSPEPTPHRCDTCGVYCTSERLLEAHTRGRKHQRRVAGIDSPAGRPSSPKVQPLVTPYFCAMCGLYATSEEQLRMHMLGKRHTRMTQLHRQRMQGVGGESGAPASLQQQQHQLLVAAAAAAALSSGAAAWVPSSSSGLPSAFEGAESPLPSPAVGGPSVALLGSGAPTSMLDGMGGGGEGKGAVALHGLLLDSSGNQRIYRCDLCGVVTPSRRHYDYHLQGIKHTRRAMRAQGLDPGSASQPGTPASCGSPATGSRSSSPVGRAGRGRHSRHNSADWGASSGTVGGGAGAAGGPADAAPESLICSVCGIMATSAVNLEDHYKGRRHQKNVERQQAQAAAASASAPGGPDAGLPPLSPLSAGTSPFAGAAAIKGAPASLQRMSSLNRSQSGITLGADGLRLPSGALLSANSLLGATGGLQRSNSDVYDDFPCVRIGSILLPSSMDLRTFLEEMQHLDGTEEMEADLLPTIEEHHETLGAELAAAVGAGLGHTLPPGGSVGGSAGAGAGAATNTDLAASAQLLTPSTTAAGGAPPQQSWSYLPVAGIAGAGAGAGAGVGPGSGTASPAQTSRSAGGSTPRGPQYQHGGSRTQPSSPSMYLLPASGTGAFGQRGSSSRPGSAGGGPRLSRFAQDQLQQAQQAQQAQQVAAQQAVQQQAAAGAGLGYAGQQYGTAYGQQYGHGQQYGMAPGGSHALAIPAGYAMQHGMGMTQQAYTAYASGAGYTGAYAPDVFAALAAQQAAAMQQHQQMVAAYGAGLAGHHGAAYAGMATQQGQQGYYQAQPPPPPPPPPPPSNRYR